MRIDKKASGSFRSRAETGMPGSSWEYQKTQNRCHVSGIGPARLLTILLRKLPGEVLEKLPPRLEIALHCNEHSRRNVLTAKKAGPVKLPKNKAIHNSASGRASRAKLALRGMLADRG